MLRAAHHEQRPNWSDFTHTPSKRHCNDPIVKFCSYAPLVHYDNETIQGAAILNQTLGRVFEIIKDNFSRKVSGNGLESLLKMHKYETPLH